MRDLINNILVISGALLALFVLFHKSIRTSKTWHATVTPLASIIGSGFLVSTPILILATGRWAVATMITIVIIAYSIGASLRFNIRYIEPLLEQSKSKLTSHTIETASRIVLGFAYMVSIAFYLKLLSAFALHGLGLDITLYENILTTLILIFIGTVGKQKGLSMLELFETYAVNTKLAIILGLILAHAAFNSELWLSGSWVLSHYQHDTGWRAFREVLGTLIIIQGFETSRYLGQAYSCDMRIRTMRYAQWISGVIYIVFMAISMIVYTEVTHVNETTVIDLCRIVAPVLPPLLVMAAILSQFSAAIADTVGSGGLIAEATKNKISINNGYILITAIAVILTWSTNIFEIVVIASKAFALYYALQILLSLIHLFQHKRLHYRWLKILVFLLLLLLMIAVVILGKPVES